MGDLIFFFFFGPNFLFWRVRHFCSVWGVHIFWAVKMFFEKGLKKELLGRSTILFFQLSNFSKHRPLGRFFHRVAMVMYIYSVPFSCNFFQGISLKINSGIQCKLLAHCNLQLKIILRKTGPQGSCLGCPSRWHQYPLSFMMAPVF